MDWYFGSEKQIAAQRKIDDLTNWCAETRGAVNGGRFLGTDDIENLGWDVIFSHLKDDGVFTFRMMPREEIAAIESRLVEAGFRIDFWSVFSAHSKEIKRHITPVVDAGLPNGYQRVRQEELTEPAIIKEIQQCMARNGVAPFSGRVLAGQSLPSALIALRDDTKNIVATAFGCLPYNKQSNWSSTAWGGLVSVDENQRGQKLGIKINALMIQDCIDRLGAEYVQEFAAETNMPSRGMIEHCGMKLDPTIMSGLATSGTERFTR